MATTKKKYKTLSTDPQIRTHEFLVDSVADLDKLPKETGSAALVASIGDIYVCNNAKEWKNISNTGIVETLEPTGTINITENGTVDVTEYATANVSVPNTSSGSGTSFGKLQPAPIIVSSKPGVGDSPFAALNISQLIDGESAITMFNPSLSNGVGTMGMPVSVAAGIPITSAIPSSYGDTIDAYICELEVGQYGGLFITTVEKWDGEVDIDIDSDCIIYNFTMPDLGGVDPETHLPETILIFHVYNDE